MSVIPGNVTFKMQQEHLVRSAFKKGIVNAVHLSSRMVDVSYAENVQSIVRNIPVADTVDMATIVVGKRCKVDLFDENNPNDSVMAYTY